MVQNVEYMNKRKLPCYFDQITPDNNNKMNKNRENHLTEVYKLNYKILKLRRFLADVYIITKIQI